MVVTGRRAGQLYKLDIEFRKESGSDVVDGLCEVNAMASQQDMFDGLAIWKCER